MRRAIDHDEIGAARPILYPLRRAPTGERSEIEAGDVNSRSTHAARLPCGSISSTASLRSCFDHATANWAARVVLPAPPLRCAIVTTNPAIDLALAEVDVRVIRSNFRSSAEAADVGCPRISRGRTGQ